MLVLGARFGFLSAQLRGSSDRLVQENLGNRGLKFDGVAITFAVALDLVVLTQLVKS